MCSISALELNVCLTALCSSVYVQYIAAVCARDFFSHCTKFKRTTNVIAVKLVRLFINRDFAATATTKLWYTPSKSQCSNGAANGHVLVGSHETGEKPCCD